MNHNKIYWAHIDPKQNETANLDINPSLIAMPKSEIYLASVTNIIRNEYGFMDSTESGMVVDRNGEPLPLYTYPMIEYLVQFDLSGKRVFEFGSGGSTLFWGKRASEVVAVETDPNWIEQLRPKIQNNVQLVFAEGKGFPESIRKFDYQFDLIIVDGHGYRYDCAAEAVDKLAPGGAVILDNSDWHPNTAALLKKAGLIQADMTGFKPSYSHASTTSIFFHREFDFPTLAKRQPAYGIGAKRLHSKEWDEPGK